MSLRPALSFRNVAIVSVFIRISLIFYSEWHDARSLVKYTDVDYRVFSDAARFLLHPTENNIAQGVLGPWLGLGECATIPFTNGQRLTIYTHSPYSRETYRYTPLLALLVTPNEWLHASFGKYLFAACDILNGYIIYSLLSTRSPQHTRQATICSAFHLLNPMVFSISTRGSSESVLCTFVLLTLYAALRDRWISSAMLLGLSTHWKLYPVIYGVSLVGVLGSPGRTGWKRLVSARTLQFAFVSAATFMLLNLSCYLV